MRNEFPVYNSIEVLKVGGSSIAIVDVIGVLPNINSQQWSVVVGKWVTRIRCVENGNVVIVFCEPSPPWTEVGNSLGWEIFEEFFNSTPFVDNQLFEFSFRFSFFRSDAMPVEGMVPMLGSVIENLVIFAAK